MEKSRKKKAESQGVPQALLPLLGLLVTVKTSLFDLVVSSGLKMLEMLLEQERAELCGVRYQHDPARMVTRAGYADGELVLGGRRVAVKRPRARTVKSTGGAGKGAEVPLPSWKFGWRLVNEPVEFAGSQT